MWITPFKRSRGWVRQKGKADALPDVRSIQNRACVCCCRHHNGRSDTVLPPYGNSSPASLQSTRVGLRVCCYFLLSCFMCLEAIGSSSSPPYKELLWTDTASDCVSQISKDTHTHAHMYPLFSREL